MNYADWPLSAPINLTWEITSRCNLNCIHCLSDSKAAAPSELTLEECYGIVDQLAALKVFEVNFGGGEPFLKDYFISLLRYIHEKGIVTCISTNGTTLTQETADLLSGNPLVNIQVSLDGATREVNDTIRGAGAFDNALRGLELLSGKGISLSINSVVTSLNFNQLEMLKELATFYGANLRVSRFRPSGRARASWERLKLDSSRFNTLTSWLTENPSILTGDSFFSIAQAGRKALGLDMCGACRMTCCITPQGDVFPCAFLQDDQFCGGNLKEQTFKDIWDNSSVFRAFRDLRPEACRSCVHFENCRGGCTAVAYFVTKDLNSADPECLMNWRTDCVAQRR